MRIARRFMGPPEYGNGGYVAGALARTVQGPARVRLKRPIPVERELAFAGGELRVGDDVIATVTAAASPPVEVPRAPTWDEAVAARVRFIGNAGPPFGGCFVCGADRDDGLRLFTGPCAHTALVAAPLEPSADLFVDGALPLEIVAAALDCPGFYAITGAGPLVPFLLGEMTLAQRAPVERGARVIAYAWPIATGDTRKHGCGSALADDSGRVLAVASSLWFRFKR